MNPDHPFSYQSSIRKSLEKWCFSDRPLMVEGVIRIFCPKPLECFMWIGYFKTAKILITPVTGKKF